MPVNFELMTVILNRIQNSIKKVEKKQQIPVDEIQNKYLDKYTRTNLADKF